MEKNTQNASIDFTNSGLKEFTIRCLTNPWGEADIISEHWRAAADLDAFKAAVFADDCLKTTQAYAELSKETEGHWYRVRKMFGDKCFKTISDVGSVKVGNESFSLCVNNGRGDGITRVAVFAKGDDFNQHMMHYSCVTVSGKCHIYDYDCGNTPAAELDGNYFVYYYEGLVAFVEF